MSKNKSSNQNWEPDVRKGLDHLRSLKDINKGLKDKHDFRKIEGFDKP